MINKEFANAAIALLNELNGIDPEATRKLVDTHVPCGDVLIEHPTIQVLTGPPQASVGLLGILNGICGSYGPEGGDKEGWGPVAAICEEDGSIFEFQLVTCGSTT